MYKRQILAISDKTNFKFPFLSRETSDEKQDKPNIYRVILRSISIGQEKLAALQISNFKPDILIMPKLHDVEPYEFYRARVLINRGREAALVNLDQFKRVLKKSSE